MKQALRFALEPLELPPLFGHYGARMRFGNGKRYMLKESWARYASLPISVSRSDNQPSIERGFPACVRGIRSQFG
jgi:hypothetical protein